MAHAQKDASRHIIAASNVIVILGAVAAIWMGITSFMTESALLMYYAISTFVGSVIIAWILWLWSRSVQVNEDIRDILLDQKRDDV